MENGSTPSSKPEGRASNRLLSIIIVLIIITPLIIMAFSPSVSFLPFIKDSDDDGTPDSNDPFPNDPTEWNDTDADGYGDNSDKFPENSTEWADSDNDGYGDNSDLFPLDPYDWNDSDGDGHGDNSDQYPNNPNEWIDSDHDGMGNNADAFPYDPSEQYDSDRDGIGNNADIYDFGNGKIEIKIEYFEGDGTYDQYGSAEDTFFKIRFDYNPTTQFSSFDYVGTSGIFYDSRILYDPYSLVFDIDDDQTKIRFSVEVFEQNEGYLPGYGIRYFDYNPGPGSITQCWLIHTVNYPFNTIFEFNGADGLYNHILCKFNRLEIIIK